MPTLPPPVATVRAFCLRILESGDLETKLAAPPSDLADEEPGPALSVEQPARDPELSFSAGAERLPRASELGSREARARCLARFAHHELMAVELFAWSLLRWPELPAELRRDFLRILTDEQKHCRMYLKRLTAHGSALEEHPRSDYFWKHVPTLDASPHGPRAFLCAMGLTLEQANLDFAGLYAEAFLNGGDLQSARVCEEVQRDEIRHVEYAAIWLRRLSGGASDLEAYTEAVPFPFAATRAKGRRFDTAARERAGLSDEFIEAVRKARSGAGRSPG
jgi:uncharacterized ferritin-like protein (DUF455 family)